MTNWRIAEQLLLVKMTSIWSDQAVITLKAIDGYIFVPFNLGWG